MQVQTVALEAMTQNNSHNQGFLIKEETVPWKTSNNDVIWRITTVTN